MVSASHELVLDLQPPVATTDGRLYRATVVARAAADGHWNAWLEFVGHGSEDVLTTDVETHQASESDLHRWATMLSDVYLQGALDRARVSRSETTAHRHAVDVASAAGRRGAKKTLDPFELYALGEHVLRRELQLFRRATLLSLIIKHDLNPKALDVSKLTKAQLVAFIATAIEVRQGAFPAHLERRCARDIQAPDEAFGCPSRAAPPRKVRCVEWRAQRSESP